MKPITEIIIGLLFVGLAVVIIEALISSPQFNQPTTGSAFGTDLPEATNYVVDQAEVLSNDTEMKVIEQLKGFDEKAQIAVLTVKTTAPYSIEEYAIKLAEKWRPGYKGKDNGVIFLIATEDRKIRIEVGRGLEGDITDSEAGKIISNVVAPRLKKAEWDGGVIDGVNAITKEIQ